MASATQKKARKGREVPTVRHEDLLRLIDRSHSTAQVQAAEREEKRKAKSPRGEYFALYFPLDRLSTMLMLKKYH